ncbi:hypothetical protein HAZT_HAZT001196 [Hyalella azteca]|uniref:INTS8 TPR repeats domain-containing protein n=1 Tax=Hyalella azteca TaxID=294128 RepID=A0A6A0H2R5_HYAAZ|nr:hypothetical protein HAZT_HAZT001196 [Hyalella azteca]
MQAESIADPSCSEPSEGVTEYREDREALLAELASKADFAARMLDTLVVGATQVHYDLGLFHFVTERYNDAFHHFTQATSIFSNLPANPVHCRVVASTLAAYQSCCSAICGRSTPVPQRTMLERFMHATTVAPNYQGLLEVLGEDDLCHELPRYLRHKLQVDLMAAPPHTTTQGLFFQVCCHNVVRSVLEGRVWEPSFPGHLVTAGKQGALYLLQLLSAKLSQLGSQQRAWVHEFLVTLNLQEGVSGALVPPLMATAPLASLFSHQQMLDMWQGVEEENQAKIMRQAMDVNYGVEGGDDASLVWEVIHSHEPVALRRAVTRYTAALQQQQAPYTDILDLNDKWDIPVPIRKTLSKIPSTLHRFLISVFVAKSQELLQSKSWVESCDLLDAALKACGEVAEGERGDGPRLYKLLTWLKLSHNIDKWISALPHTDEGGSGLASEAKLCLMSLNGREDAVPWTAIISRCVMCLVNVRDWGGVASVVAGLQLPPPYLPAMAVLRPLLAAAHILDTGPPYHLEPHFAHLWDSVVNILDCSCSHRKSSSSKSGERQLPEVLPLADFLELVYSLKEPTCLSLLCSLLGALHNKLLGDPSAEVHAQHSQLWLGLTPCKDTASREEYPKYVRETLEAVVTHAIKFFPGADHVSESTATSWHVTAADLSYNSEEHHRALCLYLTAVFVATNFLRSDPGDDLTVHLVGDRAIRRMVRCCMTLGCYTQKLYVVQAGLLCQFVEPLDYSTALCCLQDRSGVDAMDAYYHCLWDVTLIEFIINAHQKKGEIQRRDAVLKVIGQLEINSNNNEEIQREAAKVRKHRLLRALAKQYLS